MRENIVAKLSMNLENFVKGDFKGLDYVDYWAVDFDYGKKKDKEGNLIFTNHWEDFRTKKDRSLETVSAAFPCKRGVRQVAVKVVDVWANETLKVVEVKI